VPVRPNRLHAFDLREHYQGHKGSYGSVLGRASEAPKEKGCSPRRLAVKCPVFPPSRVRIVKPEHPEEPWVVEIRPWGVDETREHWEPLTYNTTEEGAMHDQWVLTGRRALRMRGRL
jgi:arginase family enzyme